MEAFGDRVRSCFQAEDVDSTVVEYLASVARDVYEGCMSVDELTDLVSRLPRIHTLSNQAEMGNNELRNAATSSLCRC